MNADADPVPRQREPIINAPVLVIGMALLLVALHGWTTLGMSIEDQIRLQYDYALVPRRFWAEATAEEAYPNLLAALVTLVSTGFLHGGWLHVIVNAGMLLAFGTPIYRGLGRSWLKWLALYLGSVIGGSAMYLALTDVTNGAAVGASGGVCGLIAAAFLLDPYGRLQSPLSRSFVMMTLGFAAFNAVITFAGPTLLGMGIAWQAHVGGYIAGAVLMLLLAPRKSLAEPVESAPAA